MKRSMTYLLLIVSILLPLHAINASSEYDEEESYESFDGAELWKKQLNDYGRGSKKNKPPIKKLAQGRLQNKIDAMAAQCADEKGTLSVANQTFKFSGTSCCDPTSSRPCFPSSSYPYPKDPGSCVGTAKAKVVCEIP